MDFASMTNDALTAARADLRDKAKTLFALEDPTPEQADEAEALVASIGQAEAEQTARTEKAKDATDRFAAAKASFSLDDADEASDESEVEASEDVAETDEVDAADETDAEDEADADADVEADVEVAAATETVEVEASKEDPFPEDAEDSADDTADAEDDGADDAEDPKKEKAPAMTASLGTPAKTSTASRVGQRTQRPAVEETKPVVITAAADIPGVPMGANLADLEAVARAAQSRVKGFPSFNASRAEATAEASGGAAVLHKFGVASFNVSPETGTTAKTVDHDYSAAQTARKNHIDRVAAGVQNALSGKPLTAAGWCAPSPYVYNWIADYKVDGLVTVPEIDAPRGGLQITTGPALAQTTFANVDDFGFGGTEAQAIAGYVKECETIECPDFVDHRLDFTGYCWKIPILTEKAYPELVTDALRLSNVLYAHKMNKRFMAAMEAQSTAVNAAGYGGTFTDTLEALTQVAVKERRWWNIGENALMEVKLPIAAREIFKFDMARRSGLALNDIATDQKVAAHFANHNLSVEYVNDWQEGAGAGAATPAWAATIKALIYPAGTFANAVEDVINLSAVYDAASLSANEYTGVFFEQGVMTVKLGYRSHVVTIPVCTAGVTGANNLACDIGSI